MPKRRINRVIARSQRSTRRRATQRSRGDRDIEDEIQKSIADIKLSTARAIRGLRRRLMSARRKARHRARARA